MIASTSQRELCAPSGCLAPPMYLSIPRCGYRGCEVFLQGRWNEHLDQWDWVDSDGKTTVHHSWVDEIYEQLDDIGSRMLIKTTKDQQPAASDAEAGWYSTTKAALNVMWIHSFHQHHPVGGKTNGSGPWCCSQPMQWTEPGWRCRVRKETTVQAVSAAVWVLWGLDRAALDQMPIELVRGSYEACTSAQGSLRAGWITGPYREGCEPLALLKICSDNLLDNGRQTSETEPMTSYLGQQEATNRAIKASAILAVLDSLSVSSEDVERLDDAGWQAAAQLAGKRQNPPADWTNASPQTRATVIGTLRQREATPDPFKGFPQ